MSQSKFYIQMFSLHGLLRAEDMEMGKDADTGGQINYVVELAKNLSTLDNVERIDLFTRLISDKRVSEDYSVPVEQVNNKFRIVRIQCGGRKYIRKELLWPFLDEYVDKTVRFIKREGRIPDLVHGHYADGGYVAEQLSEIFDIPFIFTGHSLGRSKYQKLTNEGMSENDIKKKYKIDTRIAREEEILSHAELIVTSTSQEIEEQYGLYKNKDYPEFRVIPPGIDINRFYPYYHNLVNNISRSEEELHAYASILQELHRFFMQPDKSLILALCRPDKRKNISGLITAYGEDLQLQAMANLAIFAGIRKDIHTMQENERDVLTEMLLHMDKYDLYGKMAIPKKHDFQFEVPELYRICAEKKGVFVNVALVEPFGLTLLEASATGLPIVATNDGGPKDIIRNCKNGILVDASDPGQVSQSIKKIISEPEKWEKYSRNGISNVRVHYTWEAHAGTYLKEVQKVVSTYKHASKSDTLSTNSIGKRLTALKFFLITDIDNTLIGGNQKELNQLVKILNDNYINIGFAVATGRTVESAEKYLKENNVPEPDIIVSSVGSEIYYSKSKIYDRGWDSHISRKWERNKIYNVLKDVDFLEYQEKETQRKFKISYFMEPGKDRLPYIHELLQKNKCYYNLIYSHNSYLDILPYRASKGKAIRYLSYKWEILLENMIVCGDSGNDEEMLRGEPLGIVVGNYSKELEKLKGLKNIYFADRNYAGGIIDGLTYYKFVENSNPD
ncbi:MAG: HAD-IIB family hydrolase [Spirochaetes bacterium]|nr:HAD-IIB family hydrolase [Spirochaetota bacterium]